jgi:hypothetical protein
MTLQVLILDLFNRNGSISHPFEALILFLQYYSVIDFNETVIHLRYDQEQDDDEEFSNLLKKYRSRSQSITGQDPFNGDYQNHCMNVTNPFSSQSNLCHHVTTSDVLLFQTTCRSGLQKIYDQINIMNSSLQEGSDVLSIDQMSNFLNQCFGNLKILSTEHHSKINIAQDITYFQKVQNASSVRHSQQIWIPLKTLLNQSEFFLKELQVFLFPPLFLINARQIVRKLRLLPY